MSKTKIEWVKNEDGSQGETWNLVSGCTKESPGCKNCYAERMTARLKAMGQAKYAAGFDVVKVHPDCLDQPLRWRKPRTVFVCSMADLFHPDVPFEFIAAVFGVAAATPRHNYQILTKRADRMLDFYWWLNNCCSAEANTSPRDVIHYFAREEVAEIERLVGLWPPSGSEWPLPNVWLGVTAENQAMADERIPLLLQCPAAVRWVSVEPMVGSVDLSEWIAPHTCCIGCGEVTAGDHDLCPSCKEDNAITTWGQAQLSRWESGERYTANDGLGHPDLEEGPPIDWVIPGGETGPGARPPHPDWIRSLRDQCAEAGVPFLFKGWGDWAPDCLCQTRKPCRVIDRPPGRMGVMFRCGKRVAGREIDGVLHDGYPEVEK